MDVRSRGSGSRGLRRARNDASNRSPRAKTNLVTKRRKTRKITGTLTVIKLEDARWWFPGSRKGPFTA